MRTPFIILVSLLGIYALSKDLPNLEQVLALYRDQPKDGIAGADVFRKCAICHSLAPGAHRIGPSLHCVVGRKIAAQPGFRYSAAMKSAQIDSAFGPYEPQTWTRETLSAYVLNPELTFGNTRMPFPGLMATVADEDLLEVTTALIDHLEQSCTDESHELVALQSREAAGSALTCMTIARAESLSACQQTAAELRSSDSNSDNGEDSNLPTLACIPPGKLACDASGATDQR